MISKTAFDLPPEASEALQDAIWDDDSGLFENLFRWGGRALMFASGPLAIANVVAGMLGYGLQDIGKEIDVIVKGKDLASIDPKQIAEEFVNRHSAQLEAKASILSSGKIVLAAVPKPVELARPRPIEYAVPQPVDLGPPLAKKKKITFEGTPQVQRKTSISDSVSNEPEQTRPTGGDLAPKSKPEQSRSEREIQQHNLRLERANQNALLRQQTEKANRSATEHELSLKEKLEIEKHKIKRELDLDHEREMRKMRGEPATPEEHAKARALKFEEAKKARELALKQERQMAKIRAGASSGNLGIMSIFKSKIGKYGVIAALAALIYTALKATHGGTTIPTDSGMREAKTQPAAIEQPAQIGKTKPVSRPTSNKNTRRISDYANSEISNILGE